MNLFCFVGIIKGSASYISMKKERGVSNSLRPLVYTDLQAVACSLHEQQTFA